MPKFKYERQRQTKTDNPNAKALLKEIKMNYDNGNEMRAKTLEKRYKERYDAVPVLANVNSMCKIAQWMAKCSGGNYPKIDDWKVKAYFDKNKK